MNNSSNKTLLIGILIALFATWFAAKKSSKKATPIVDTITVGTNAEYPPFATIDNDAIIGFDIDIAREICDRLGKKIELVNMPFDALVPSIQLGKIQIIAAGMTATPERAQQMLFTKPYLAGDPLLIISPKNFPINSIAELNEKDVIVNDGFTADAYISELDGPVVKRLKTVGEAFLALEQKRGHAFVSAQSAVQPFFENNDKSKFHVARIEGTDDNYSLAVAKKSPKLFNQVQEALNEMQEDGTLDDLKRKWRV